MLHTEVVSGKTLELLKKLEAENAMTRFNLAGGTSLALYLGHRRSVDLDLFTPKPFDAAELERFLMDKYGFRTGFMERNTLKGSIDGIKIDCITHSYEYLEKPYIEYGIRLYSMQDIIAMKLSAIADDGSRLKDFIDIAFLSTRFPFNSMLGMYERKFEQDGKIYHHIIDPETGFPANSGIVSATVITKDDTLADALSTALFVMGP